MKRSSFVSLSLLITLITLFACSKNDPEKGIIGKWQLIKDEYYTDGQLTKTVSYEGSVLLTFASNGNYIIEADGRITDSGLFTVSDTYLTLVSTEYGGPYTEILMIQSLNRKELILVDSYREIWSYLTKIH